MQFPRTLPTNFLGRQAPQAYRRVYMGCRSMDGVVLLCRVVPVWHTLQIQLGISQSFRYALP